MTKKGSKNILKNFALFGCKRSQRSANIVSLCVCVSNTLYSKALQKGS